MNTPQGDDSMSNSHDFQRAFLLGLSSFCCFCGSQLAIGAEIKILASIAPIHSLVSEVVAGSDIGDPELLIQGKASPHSFTLRPSDVRKLRNADVFFLVSETLETSTMHTLESLESDTSVIELMNISGINLVQIVESDSHEEEDQHGHGHGHGHGHEHDATHPMSGYDHHIWLDPANAIIMVEEISRVLSALDPENAETFRSNATRLSLGLEGLMEEIMSELESSAGSDFIVFHDAYKSFENRFGLGTSSHPILLGENRPGARRMQDIREKLTSAGVRCVFKEPQYDTKILDVLVDGTEARVAELDPLGANLEVGEGQYFALIRNIATTLKDCLSK